ncbi:MAG TPA: hypothetical protein VIL32_09430 [Steroidobacteraceae bacterium]
MNLTTGLRRLVLVATLGAIPLSQAASPTAETFRQEVEAGVEEIFVFRTTRTKRTPGPTPACESAPFPSAAEDHYDLWSIQMRTSDARVIETHNSAVGGFTACFAAPVQGQPLQMHAIGTIAEIPWTGTGQCTPVQSQPPVRTVVAFNCVLNLTSLPESYAGGFLVSSTAAPNLGKGADPAEHVPGYLSTSVVTARFWRKPPAEGNAASAEAAVK